MLRLLRRYNKALLVVGGVLLMVAWAIGGTISQLAGQSAMTGRVWATVGGKDVRGSELLDVQAELQVLEALGPEAIPVAGATRDPVHYYLLRREALDAGLVGTPEDGLRAITDQLAAARMVNPAVPEVQAFLGGLQATTGQSPEVILRTIATANGINRLLSLYDGAPRLSDRRMRRAASELFTAVDADFLVLDARRLARDLDWTPSETQLEAQLAKFGETAPGPGSQYAYRLSDRLKLEWLVVPAASVRAALEASEKLSNIELRKHRDRNLAIFPKPVDGTDDFEVLKEAIKQNRTTALLDEEMAAISKFATDRLLMPLRSVPREGVYVTLPEDWEQRKASFEELAKEISAQFAMPLPSWSTSGPEWVEVRGVDRLPGIDGASAERFGPAMSRLSQLVGQLKEFGGSDTFALQVGVAGPPLRNANGDLILWRVISADPARAPRSVDEVRERLVADVKAIEQFNRLVAELPGLREQASREGLLSVASANQVPLESARAIRESNIAAAARGTLMSTPLPGLGIEPTAVKAMVEFAMSLPLDPPIAEQSEESRLFTVALPDRLAVVVGRITGVTPVVAEDFEALSGSGAIAQLVLGPQVASLREELFSKTAMEARFDFKLAKEFEETEESTTVE
jgi:hypothetical protein